MGAASSSRPPLPSIKNFAYSYWAIRPCWIELRAMGQRLRSKTRPPLQPSPASGGGKKVSEAGMTLLGRRMIARAFLPRSRVLTRYGVQRSLLPSSILAWTVNSQNAPVLTGLACWWTMFEGTRNVGSTNRMVFRSRQAKKYQNNGSLTTRDARTVNWQCSPRTFLLSRTSSLTLFTFTPSAEPYDP